MNIRLPLCMKKKVLSGKIHKKMQFVGTTSLVPKAIGQTKKQVVPKHVGTRRVTLKSGSCGGRGFLFGAGIVFMQTHRLSFLTSCLLLQDVLLMLLPTSETFLKPG